MTLSSHHNIPELIQLFWREKNHQIFCRHQQKKFTSPVNVKVQTIWTYLTLTYLQCIECWSLSSSQCAGWLLLHSLSSRCRLILSSLRTLEFSRRPLTAPPSPHLITQGGCCVASHRAAVSSSRRPLTAPPSRHLITQAGCCVATHCATISSSRHPLTAPPSRHLIVPSGCCVTSCHAAVSSSCRPLTAPPSPRLAPAGCCVATRCAALSSSRQAALLSSRCVPARCCVASIKRLCCRYRCSRCRRRHRHHCC